MRCWRGGAEFLLSSLLLLNLLQFRFDFAFSFFAEVLDLLVDGLAEECLVLAFLFLIFVGLGLAQHNFGDVEGLERLEADYVRLVEVFAAFAIFAIIIFNASI